MSHIIRTQHRGRVYDWHVSHCRHATDPAALLGVYEIGTPSNGFRFDRWTTANPPYTTHNHANRFFCDGEYDISPEHNSSPSYGGNYSHDCPECWLGFPHTQQKHRANLRRLKEEMHNARKEAALDHTLSAHT